MATIGRLFGIGKRAVRYRSLDTARLIEDNLSHILAPLRPDGRKIRCDEIDLSIDPERQPFFLEGLEYAYRLVKTGQARFVTLNDGRIEFQFGPVRIVPETAQELAILDEIFRVGLYDIDTNLEWLVWDVGMNVGIATAFFAGIKRWEVVSYEPFPEPFQTAVANLERSGLQSLTTLRQQGISDRDQILTLQYNHHSRGSNGLYGNNAVNKAGGEIEVEASFVDAATVVEELVERAAGRPILAKIDCEGAEYSIVRRLKEQNLLRHLGAIFMEYHLLAAEHGYDVLVNDLLEAGYVVRGQRYSQDHVGMIWAFNDANRS